MWNSIFLRLQSVRKWPYWVIVFWSQERRLNDWRWWAAWNNTSFLSSFGSFKTKWFWIELQFSSWFGRTMLFLFMLLNNRALSFAQEHANQTDDFLKAIPFIERCDSKWQVDTLSTSHLQRAHIISKAKWPGLTGEQKPIGFGLQVSDTVLK